MLFNNILATISVPQIFTIGVYFGAFLLFLFALQILSILWRLSYELWNPKIGAIPPPLHPNGQRVLIVQPIDEHGLDHGDSFLSCDATSAASGDVVLVQQQGSSARQLLGKATDPFHSVICGIVDKVTTY